MKLKNSNETPKGGFAFYYLDAKTGKEIRIPSGTKSANGLKQLGIIVRSALRNNGQEVPDNIDLVIEHQICLRQPKPTDVCFSGGIGDDLHHKVMKPILGVIARAAKAAKLKPVARAAQAIGSCSGCSGTRTYDSTQKSNLGRAGKLNNLNKGFAADSNYRG